MDPAKLPQIAPGETRYDIPLCQNLNGLVGVMSGWEAIHAGQDTPRRDGRWGTDPPYWLNAGSGSPSPVA